MPTARPTSVRLRASLLAALFKRKTRHSRAAPTPPQGVNATTPFAGTPWGRPVIYVADVDALYARARAAGLAPEFAPRDAGWGARRRRVPRRSRVRQLLVVLKKATRPSHGTAHSGERCFRSYSRRCQAIRPLYDATFRRALLPHHRPRRPRARVRAAAASAGRRHAAAAAMTLAFPSDANAAALKAALDAWAATHPTGPAPDIRPAAERPVPIDVDMDLDATAPAQTPRQAPPRMQPPQYPAPPQTLAPAAAPAAPVPTAPPPETAAAASAHDAVLEAQRALYRAQAQQALLLVPGAATAGAPAAAALPAQLAVLDRVRDADQAGLEGDGRARSVSARRSATTARPSSENA